MSSEDPLPPDAFSITVRIPNGRYPSVNHTHDDGFRGGKKSDEYKALKRAVRAAAHREMKRIGWTQPAAWYVSIELVRLVPDRRRRDPANLGKAELDSLEPGKPGDPDYNPLDPFPGLYLDDDYALVTPKIELDLGGIDRVTITARRVYPPLHDAPMATAARPTSVRQTVAAGAPFRAPRRRNVQPVVGKRPKSNGTPPAYDGVHIPAGWALDGDVLIPLDQALRQIQRRPVRRR